MEQLYPKKGGLKVLNGFDIFTPNIPLHNRVPSKQLYY
jgi:hypothetical protein